MQVKFLPAPIIIMLIKCRECGKQVSNETDKCPYCGIPAPDENKWLKEQKHDAKKKRIGCLSGIVFVPIISLIVGITWAINQDASIFEAIGTICLLVAVGFVLGAVFDRWMREMI